MRPKYTSSILYKRMDKLVYRLALEGRVQALYQLTSQTNIPSLALRVNIRGSKNSELDFPVWALRASVQYRNTSKYHKLARIDSVWFALQEPVVDLSLSSLLVGSIERYRSISSVDTGGVDSNCFFLAVAPQEPVEYLTLRF